MTAANPIDPISPARVNCRGYVLTDKYTQFAVMYQIKTYNS